MHLFQNGVDLLRGYSWPLLKLIAISTHAIFNRVITLLHSINHLFKQYFIGLSANNAVSSAIQDQRKEKYPHERVVAGPTVISPIHFAFGS